MADPASSVMGNVLSKLMVVGAVVVAMQYVVSGYPVFAAAILAPLAFVAFVLVVDWYRYDPPREGYDEP